jgi:hypothetical protein
LVVLKIILTPQGISLQGLFLTREFPWSKLQELGAFRASKYNRAAIPLSEVDQRFFLQTTYLYLSLTQNVKPADWMKNNKNQLYFEYRPQILALIKEYCPQL